jgi:hypothetical protein
MVQDLLNPSSAIATSRVDTTSTERDVLTKCRHFYSELGFWVEEVERRLEICSSTEVEAVRGCLGKVANDLTLAVEAYRQNGGSSTDEQIVRALLQELAALAVSVTRSGVRLAKPYRLVPMRDQQA